MALDCHKLFHHERRVKNIPVVISVTNYNFLAGDNRIKNFAEQKIFCPVDRVEIKFKKVGGTRGISQGGLSSERAFNLVNTSPIGAAIVGTWQSLNRYIPCRAFKNIAAGAIPISNANFSHVFGDSYIHEESLPKLVDTAINMKFDTRKELNAACKEKLVSYSYQRAFSRMLEVLH